MIYSSGAIAAQSRSEKVKRSIIKIRSVIRKKFRDLHNHRLAVNKEKQIIEPLQSIAKRGKEQNVTSVKVEKEEKADSDYFRPPNSIFKTAIAAHRNIFDIAHGSSASADRRSNLNNISGVSPMADSEPKNEEELEEKIIKTVQNLNSPYVDSTYGFKSKDGQLLLGKDTVLTKNTKGGLVYSIRKKNFPVTPGLTDLSLSKNPKFYTEKDLQTYKDMLQLTSAHRKNCQKSGKINRAYSQQNTTKSLPAYFHQKKRKERVWKKQQ